LLEGSIEIDPEYTFPGYEDLAALDNWVHINPDILKAGRVKHFVSSKLNEDQAAEAMAKLEEKDPATERLKSIKDDKRKQDVTISFPWIRDLLET